MTRARQPVDEVNRRSSAVDVPLGGVRSDQAVEVPRLELVRVARHRFEIADPVVARASLEHVLGEGQRRQGRVAAGAAASNGETIRIGLAVRRQIFRRVHAVGHVDDAPLAVQPPPVRAPIPGAAAVVDIHHGKAAAGPVLHLQIQARARRRRRTTMADDDERWPLAGGCREVPVARRVVERMCRQPTSSVGNSIASGVER